MLKNDYITIAEASERWRISQRQVQHLCTLGSVNGAVKFGRAWMIPRNAKKPVDGRTKAARAEYEADMPLPRKTPFLYMSDLYHTPGTADEVGVSLSYNHEAQVLFEAEVAYSRGEIDKVYDIANSTLKPKAAEACACEDKGAELEMADGYYVFATAKCPNCKIACALLDKAGILYTKLLAEENRELTMTLDIKQAPTLVNVVGGEAEKFVSVPNIKKFIQATVSVN